MPENVRLSGCSDEISLEFVEQKETPQPFIIPSIRFYLAELYFLNIVLSLEIFGVYRVRSLFIAGSIRPIYS